MWVRDPGQQSNLSGHNPHLLVLHPPVREDARFAEELHHNLEMGREGMQRMNTRGQDSK